MTNRREEIARRKQALIEKAALERLELATAFHRIRSSIDMGGALFALGRTLRSHPWLTAGLSTFLLGGFGKKVVTSAGLLIKLARLIPPILHLWPKRRR